MNGVQQIPAWAAVLTAVLLFLGAAVTLVGSLGLLRLGSFYERVHAPTLGTTVGTGLLLLASMIFFSVLQTRTVVHEVIVVLFVALTTPVTLTILVRAALFATRPKTRTGFPSKMADNVLKSETASSEPDTSACLIAAL